MTRAVFVLIAAMVLSQTVSTPANGQARGTQSKTLSRSDSIARAQVWLPTDVHSVDIKAGPREPGAFPFLADVTCDYLPKVIGGKSPKFVCKSGEDELTVKFGADNAEVYGATGATRLLWALGFGADRSYPVRVVCRGCPARLGGTLGKGGDRVFDPAIIQRKMPGRVLYDSWSWRELSKVKAEEGGAPQAHRDALMLLAVFLQHTDSKRQQQRIECLDQLDHTSKAALQTAIPCARPFMMISDLGLTFGKANKFNANGQGVHLAAWAAKPIWKPGDRCVADLPKSWTGTLDNPVISEGGRAFLADLLTRLSDDQIRALFEVARMDLRLRDPGKPNSGHTTVDEWIDVFKRKRAEIVDRRCT